MISDVSQDKVKAELAFYETLANSSKEGHPPVPFVNLDAHFTVEGPNGCHACFILQPMGPHIDEYLRNTPSFLSPRLEELDQAVRLPKTIAKRVLREVLAALQLLHSNGITHGDLHVGNILVNIKSDDLNGTPPFEVGQVAPDGDVLERNDGRKDLWAPEYLLPPKTLFKFASFDCDPLVKLTDLGSGKDTSELSSD